MEHEGHRTPRRRGRVRVLAAVGALLLAAGCKQEEVTHFRVAKAQPAPALAKPASMPAGPAGGAMAGDVPTPPTPTGASALKWTLPKGWQESLVGGMRYATLKPPVAGRIDGSVVVLPGPAGGELANVNRWRGQIGLAAMDEAGLAAARKTLRTKAGPVNVYDFTSDGNEKSRLVAGLTEADGNTWFVKLTGEAGAVGSARPEFIHLLESLRFEATERR